MALGWFVLAGALTLSAYLNARQVFIVEDATVAILRGGLSLVLLFFAALSVRKALRQKGEG